MGHVELQILKKEKKEKKKALQIKKLILSLAIEKLAASCGFLDSTLEASIWDAQSSHCSYYAFV